MAVPTTIQKIRAAFLTAAIGTTAFFELAGCSLMVGEYDPPRPVQEDESVLHVLFPELEAITEGYLAAGSVGGLAFGDFDCDSRPDLAVGDPDQNLPGAIKAGVVHVIYGRGGQQTIYQNQLGQMPVAANAAFGLALASGDFGGFGCDDLAIGAPGHGVSGKVHVVYGIPGGGLMPGAAENEVLNGQQTDEYFGLALAAGDFDGDGIDDVAVGIPKKDVKGENDAGAVEIYYGAESGGITSSAILTQSTFEGADVKGSPEKNDLFGFAVAAGDFDGNGVDDLAVGVPAECRETWTGSCESLLPDGSRGGGVNVFYGVPGGLQAASPQDQYFGQNTTEVKGKSEHGDALGFALATGDFDGDGLMDLAAGAPGEDDGRGAVNVLYGSASGLQADGSDGGRQDQLWEQDCTNQNTCGSFDLEGDSEGHTFFGFALATGDLDGDGSYDDLAVGAPNGRVGEDRTGTMNVLLGSSAGLDVPGNELVDQNTAGTDSPPEESDFFAGALATADLDRDGRDELAVRVNDGEYCAVDILDDLGRDGVDYFGCSADGVPLWISPFDIGDPNQVVVQDPPEEEFGPGQYDLPHWDWEFFGEPETLELVAGPTKLTPGQTLVVSWDVGAGILVEEDDDTLAFQIAESAPVESNVVLFAPIASSTSTSSLVGGGGNIGGDDPPVLEQTHPNDWIGLFPIGASSTESVEWRYTDAIEDGHMLFTAPSTVGEYKLRYMLDNGHETAATSNRVLIVPEVELIAIPETATGNDPMAICWGLESGQAFGANDRIGLYEFGAPNDAPILGMETDGAPGGCRFFTAPDVGTHARYQLRYMLSNGYGDAAAIDIAVEPRGFDAPEPPDPIEPKCGLGSGLVLLLPAILRLRRRWASA